ncbi:MAG: 2-phosphosulfolactate phosphatase [Candidatus Kapaibacterium sp.]
MIATEAAIRHAAVVVIDVLRATSTIVSALMNGAREVIPVVTIEEAVAIAHRLGTDRTLLGGERGALKINGFRFGNSPLEYTPEEVHGKTIVLSTSNGAPALLMARNSEFALCGALVNASAVAELLIEHAPEDIVLLCSGSNGECSLEDSLGAGAIIAAMKQSAGDDSIIMTDGARVAEILFHAHRKDLFAALRSTDHGRILDGMGLEDDLRFCSQLDIPGAPVPALVGSSIKPYQRQSELKTVARFL